MRTKYTHLISLFLFCFLISCDNRTALDIYKEQLNEQTQGKVRSTELWKGGLLVIHLRATDGSESIAEVNNDHDVLASIKKGDYFEKHPNSNKCLIRRNDSILFLDCIKLERLEKEVRNSLLPVEQWERQEINQWNYKPE